MIPVPPEILVRVVADPLRASPPPGVDAAYLARFLDRQHLVMEARIRPMAPTWSLPPDDAPVPAPPDARPDNATLLPLEEYDKILVGFSGGKDSVACVLYLLDQLRTRGVEPAERIELWHHCVDGEPGTVGILDWPCTEAYCRDLAGAFGLPYYRSWREGGFLREMQRNDAPTAPVTFEGPAGRRTTGGLGPEGTRGRFPQVSADLSVRWCSAYLKIMVASSAIANDPRFARDVKLLVVTGERRAESANRARYARTEMHRASAPSKGRIVHQHRPLLAWSDARVWEELRRWGVVAHPCYWLGFGRASCETCIFSQAPEWATIAEIHPKRLEMVTGWERWTGQTIHRKLSVPELAARGRSMAPSGPIGAWWRQQAVGRFDAPIQVKTGGWVLPTGAFRSTAGPV